MSKSVSVQNVNSLVLDDVIVPFWLLQRIQSIFKVSVVLPARKIYNADPESHKVWLEYHLLEAGIPRPIISTTLDSPSYIKQRDHPPQHLGLLRLLNRLSIPPWRVWGTKAFGTQWLVYQPVYLKG